MTIDLSIIPADNDRTRLAKYLLTYGTHKITCDLSCYEPSGLCPDHANGEDKSCMSCYGVQHKCCSCEWCQIEDWAWEILSLGCSGDIEL